MMQALQHMLYLRHYLRNKLDESVRTNVVLVGLVDMIWKCERVKMDLFFQEENGRRVEHLKINMLVAGIIEYFVSDGWTHTFIVMRFVTNVNHNL